MLTFLGVGGGLNTLAWTGNTPSDFQVFLVHPDVDVLVSQVSSIYVTSSQSSLVCVSSSYVSYFGIK
jgi:hypothetical protein